MNLTDILSVLGGAVLGAAVAYINMRISKANLNASNMAAVMGVNMLRLLLDAAALAVCFFVCRAYELPMCNPHCGGRRSVRRRNAVFEDDGQQNSAAK